ncbi:MAG: OmpA family protein [Methylotenera sp.]|nr:OmpA family protein [Methylotenera sp.]MDP1755120.1 OmpA family protein [Methylotenera sp.]
MNAVQDRMTDQAIKADQATYAATQARIAALNNTGIPVADYNLSKAQCWLDVSLHEYTRNDRSNFTQEALTQSDAILTALEQNTQPNPAEQTPLVNHADKLRDDLWAKAANLKAGKGLKCYAQKLACAEVELVHAGNENKQQGWRHAKPYIQIAEDLVAEAEATGNRCIPAPVPAPVVAQPNAPVAAPVVAEVEQINLSADALFKFDKSTGDALLPEGRATLDGLITKLKIGYVQINSISLIGYTDRLGSAQYNQKLSEQRALTVKRYLQNGGINHVIEAEGRGKADQVVACGTSTKPTNPLTDCLQTNRRVTVQITGVKRNK